MKITGLSINCMEYQQDFWMSSAQRQSDLQQTLLYLGTNYDR